MFSVVFLYTNLGISNLVIGNAYLGKIASAQGSANSVGADFLQPKASLTFGQHCGCCRGGTGFGSATAGGDNGRRHGGKDGNGKSKLAFLLTNKQFRIAHQTVQSIWETIGVHLAIILILMFSN